MGKCTPTTHKIVLFDLDNTLYDVRQYFKGAFQELAAYISRKHPISQRTACQVLKDIWKQKTSMYPYLFNDVVKVLNLDEREVKKMIDIFNLHEGKLQPYPHLLSMMKKLKKQGCKLGIVTDGTIQRQKRKVRSLRIRRFFDAVVFTKELGGSKQSILPFQKVLHDLHGDSSHTFFVGDNPSLDFQGPKKLGIVTMRLLQGEFRSIPSNVFVDYEIKNLKEIPPLVEHL